MMRYKIIGVLLILLGSQDSFAQVFLEDFEGGGSITSTTGAYCSNGSDDYFGIESTATISAVLTGNTSDFFAAQDIDGCGGNSNTETIQWDNVDITGCSGLSLSVDLAEDDDGSNQDWDDADFVHIEVNIDGTGWTPVIWVENDGTTFNAEPLIDTDYDGNGDGAAITDIWQTFTQAIAGTGTSMDIRIVISLDSGDEDIAIDNLTVTGSGCSVSACSPDPEPTTPPSNITFSDDLCTSITIDWTVGNGDGAIVVISTSPIGSTPSDQTAYAASSTYGGGDDISGGAGEYVVYNGAGNTVTVTGLTAGTTYYVAIFEYNGTTNNCNENYLTSSFASASYTMNTGCVICPYMTSLLINSCESTGPCDEGDNEIIFMNSGSYTIPVSSANINFSYGSTNPPTDTYVDAITSNAAAITDMDNAAGCPGLFVDANAAGSIPPNTSYLIVHNDICPATALDFSAWCGSGPIYVVFSTDPTWSAGGNFVNSTGCSGGIRYIQTDYSNVAGAGNCIIDYDYDCTQNTGTDGDFTTYTSLGGSPTSYENNGCTLPAIILSVEWLSFNAFYRDQRVDLYWSTGSELNNDFFEVQKSIDGMLWTKVTTVDGAGTSSSTSHYDAIDPNPFPGVSYYRIKQVDNDGEFSYSATVAVERSSDKFEIIDVLNSDNEVVIRVGSHSDVPYSFRIYDMTGKLIRSGRTTASSFKLNKFEHPAGIYSVMITDGHTVETRKILVD